MIFIHAPTLTTKQTQTLTTTTTLTLTGQDYIEEAHRRGWMVCVLNRRGHGGKTCTLTQPQVGLGLGLGLA
jgi:hypothetical protein